MLEMQDAASLIVALVFAVLAAGAGINAWGRPGVSSVVTGLSALSLATLQDVMHVGDWQVHVMLLAVAAATMCSAGRGMLAATQDARLRGHFAGGLDSSYSEDPSEAIGRRAAEIARQVAEPSWRRVLWETKGVVLLNFDRDGRIRRVDGGGARRWFTQPSAAVGQYLSVLGPLAGEIAPHVEDALKGESASWQGSKCAYRIAPTYDATGDVDGAVVAVLEA